MSSTIQRVAVIGAGQMGNGITHVFAQYGCQVTMIDTAPDLLEKAKATIGANLDRQVKKGTLSEDVRNATLSRIHTSVNLVAVEGADLVIEAVSERRELKDHIFQQVDGMVEPATILASNTSSISITELASATSARRSTPRALSRFCIERVFASGVLSPSITSNVPLAA